MRSRAEARAAAFFDEFSWVWEYEPFDLAGYIPDFVLHFQTAPVLIEVKGSTEDIEIAKSKLEVSGWEKEAIIISRQPGPLYGSTMVEEFGLNDWVIGNLLERQEHPDAAPRWHLALIKFCISCGQKTFISDSDSWHCRHCGACDGNTHIGDFDPGEVWAKASNRVQWRAE